MSEEQTTSSAIKSIDTVAAPSCAEVNQTARSPSSNVVSLKESNAYLTRAEKQAAAVLRKDLCGLIGEEMQSAGDSPTPHQLKLWREWLLDEAKRD